jgi:hypothetical protein
VGPNSAASNAATEGRDVINTRAAAAHRGGRCDASAAEPAQRCESGCGHVIADDRHARRAQVFGECAPMMPETDDPDGFCAAALSYSRRGLPGDLSMRHNGCRRL